MATEFVHLHNHSEYSMLDGACRIEDMSIGHSKIARLLSHLPTTAICSAHGNCTVKRQRRESTQLLGVKCMLPPAAD